MEGPRAIGELSAFTLHRVEVGRRKVILVKHEPHVVERLGRIAAVFDGKVEQVERVFARSLNDNGNLAFVCRTQSGAHTLKVARLSLLALGHHEVASHLHYARANLAFATTPALRLLRHHANPTPRCG